jgi:energy-coupling factor transport system ATP-binding protein
MLRKAESRVETVVIASHDLQLVAGWADRVIVLDDGDLLADAPPTAVFDDTELLDAADLRQPQVVDLSDRLGADAPVLTTDAMVEAITAAAEAQAGDTATQADDTAQTGDGATTSAGPTTDLPTSTESR